MGSPIAPTFIEITKGDNIGQERSVVIALAKGNVDA
jgi:hypothetical protein